MAQVLLKSEEAHQIPSIACDVQSDAPTLWLSILCPSKFLPLFVFQSGKLEKMQWKQLVAGTGTPTNLQPEATASVGFMNEPAVFVFNFTKWHIRN